MAIYRCFQAILRGIAVCGCLGWHGVMVAGVPTAEDYGLVDQSVDVWETAQGLPQNTVTAIAQTRDGYLWVGTEGGLACFDGSRFQTFTALGDTEFASSRITALCADRDGGLWIGTAEGGARYLFRGQFLALTTRDGLASNDVRAIGVAADRSVWISTAKGVSLWRNGRLEQPTAGGELLADGVLAICDWGEGRLSLLGPAGVFATAGTVVSRLPITLLPAARESSWQGLVPGQGGNLWLFGKSLARLSMGGQSAAVQNLTLQPDQVITAVCERRDGEVWFGTKSGHLRRLDNQGMSPMLPVAGPTIRCLFEDRELNLWLGLEGGGLARVKPKRVQTFGLRDGLPGEHITGMCSDGKRGLWVGCHANGIAHWSDGEFLPFTANDTLPKDCVVWSLALSGDGALWIGTEGAGLLRWKDGRLERFGPEQGMTQSSIRSLLVTLGGNLLYIGGRDGGLLQWTAAGFVRYGAAEGFDGENLTAMVADGTGGVWIGTESQGLYHFADKKFTRFTRIDGLGSDHVRSLLRDEEGVLWIGTTGGLTRLKGGKFQNLDSRHGLWDNTISQILEENLDRGAGDRRLWLGTNRGIIRLLKPALSRYLDGKPVTLESVAYGRAEGMDCLECSGGFSPAGMVQNPAENPDTRSTLIWVPTLRGLARLDVMKVLSVARGISGDHIAFTDAWLHLGPEGKRFNLGDVVAGGDGFGTGRAAGINVLNGELRQNSETYARSDSATDAMARYHRGKVPFVDGVFIPDGGKSPDRSVVISSTGLKAEFPPTTGEAWGLLKSGYRPAARDVFNASEMEKIGVPMIWLSGNQGITFDLDAIRRATGEPINRFTARACNLHIGPGSFHVLLDGKVVARRSGLVHDSDRFERGIVPLDIPVPENVRFLTLAATDDKDEAGVLNWTPPPIIIEEVRADGAILSPVGAGDSTSGTGALHPDFSHLEIEPGAGRLDFRYAAPSLAAPEKVRFRYRLEPLEEVWVEAGDHRTANYTNLSPGTYRFVVTACNNDGVWNELGTSVSLILRPHIWQTRWFTPLWISTLTLAIAAITGLSFRSRHRREIRRLKHLHALAAERTRIARDLHDDLGAGLTQVVLLSDMARSENGKPERANVHHDQVLTVARRLARSLDEIVWAINPKNDALEDSLSFVCKSAQDFLRAAGISCRLDWPEDLSGGLLSSSRRHQLYLAVREILNNVVKHADATEVRIRLAVSGSDLTMEIRDNGRGFVVPPPGAPSLRHGLEGMAGRMSSVGGGIEIASEPGQGATVRLRMPIHDPKDDT